MKKIVIHPAPHFRDLKDMLATNTVKYADKAVFMQKVDGVYQDISYKKYGEDVNGLGTALLSEGLKDKRIMVIGENCYDWVTAYMAVICGVGVVVPVDKELSAEEIANIAEIGEVSAVFHSNRESIRDKVATLPESIRKIPFAEIPTLVEKGKELIGKGNTTYFDVTIDANVMASLIFTSGTTGVSKGVMLSHHNICYNIEEMVQNFAVPSYHVFLSVLPLHHVYECSCGFLCQIASGTTVAFSEGLRYITKNMQEVHPTFLLCVPLLLETMYKKVWANIRKQGLEEQVNNVIKATNLLPDSIRMKAKRKAFAKIHEFFGGKLEVMFAGGAAVDPAILKGLRDFGILAVQGYGLTECSPLAAVNRDTLYKDNSAGTATPHSILDIYDPASDGTGEIRYKGENVMLGYYKQPELTAKTIRDGWFYTGDIGYIDEDGYLIITGRKKNVIVTYNGKNIFPEELESYLSRSSCVAESVVVGYMNAKKKDYDIIALILPNREYLEGKYGREVTPSQIDEEMKKALELANDSVQSYKRMAGYILVDEPFPKNTSQKIKRKGILEAHQQEYDAWANKEK